MRMENVKSTKRIMRPPTDIRSFGYYVHWGRGWRLLMYIGRWRVPAANSKKLEEMFRALITHVRANPQRYPQLRSAVICSSVQNELSEEDWMWVEEYADREAYDAFYKALEEDKTFLEIHDKQYDFWRLIVEGSFKGELFTERARF
jgi:hypothetical protein